jgi:hypothetical protein
MFMDDSGRLFGKINLIDFSALLVLLLAAVGVIAVQSGWHQTSGQVVKGETDIEYTVMLYNLRTLQPDLFKPGKTLSITIRNQPRGEVKIVNASYERKKSAVPLSSGQVNVIDDPTQPNAYDYRITLRDHALISHEGYVTEGIKVKIGLPIEVEGFNYRVNGIISDVREVASR